MVGLRRLSRADPAAKIRIAERTVDKRYRAAINALTAYLNAPGGQPPLRDFRLALDVDPLEALEECVRRHQQIFERLAEATEADPGLRDLSVTWLPAKGSCVPVLSSEVDSP